MLINFLYLQNERNLWLNATKCYLRNNCCSVDNLFICMRHFSDECLHSASYKIWKDGCEVDVQRKYRKLKKNSVPSIFEVSIHLACLYCDDCDL